MKKETNPIQIVLFIVLFLVAAFVAFKLFTWALGFLTIASIFMWIFMPFLVLIGIVLLVLNLLKKK